MNWATVLRLPKRLVIDNQVLTQLNKHCLFAIKFSRSVEFAASQSYLLNSTTNRLNARPVYTRQSLKQTMQYKHLLSHTSYANTCTSCYAAPLMQTPATQSTCCLCKPPQQIPAKGPLLSDTPTKMIEPRREIYLNLGRISSLNFRHKPT